MTNPAANEETYLLPRHRGHFRGWFFLFNWWDNISFLEGYLCASQDLPFRNLTTQKWRHSWSRRYIWKTTSFWVFIRQISGVVHETNFFEGARSHRNPMAIVVVQHPQQFPVAFCKGSIQKSNFAPRSSSPKRSSFNQWLFLVPVKGGRWHIIPQLAGKIPLIYHLYIAF